MTTHINGDSGCYKLCWGNSVNTLRPRQHGRHFADNIFKCIFLNENIWIPIIISLRFVPMGPINNIPALVQIMAWRHPGDKPLSEPMMVCLLTHICVAQPQRVNKTYKIQLSYCFHVYTMPERHTWRTLNMSLVLTHWGRDKMAAILQTTFSNIFSWMKMYEFRLRFHWSLFLSFELTIFQHWFR